MSGVKASPTQAQKIGQQFEDLSCRTPPSASTEPESCCQPLPVGITVPSSACSSHESTEPAYWCSLRIPLLSRRALQRCHHSASCCQPPAPRADLFGTSTRDVRGSTPSWDTCFPSHSFRTNDCSWGAILDTDLKSRGASIVRCESKSH